MRPAPLTRREFLQSTAAVGTAAAVAPFSSRHFWHRADLSSDGGAVPDWASKPMRWMQLTLVEDDPAHFDPAFWLDYFKRTRSEGVCLSGGGCVAYYPTEIPFHHRSAWLGDRDVSTGRKPDFGYGRGARCADCGGCGGCARTGETGCAQVG